MRVPAGILRILKGERRTPLYFFALSPFSLIYRLVTGARAALYKARLIKTNALPCKVVSVGNITSGGTGKTPMVIYMAGKLKSKGMKAAVLTRGYGGAFEGRVEAVSDENKVLLEPRQAGDEAVMMARRLPGVPVVMGRNRYLAGRLAVERFRPDVVLLDDGYQHIALRRDLDILLMDAKRPFGNGYVLPMGYLREPKEAIKRADVVVLTNANADGVDAKGETLVRAISPAMPIMRAAHRARRLYGLWDGAEMGLGELAGRKVMPVSGVADPASFALILKKLNVKITGAAVYPDHYRYRQKDMAAIEKRAVAEGAELAVTTEKDAVKLASLNPCRLRFLVLCVDIEFIEGAGALEALLAK